jgi:hypothetical protein
MRKYLNKKCITIFLTILLAFILLGNYLTCPQYIKPIGLDSFNGSLVWYKYYKFNSTVIHYNGFLGEADFGLIAYFFAPVLRSITASQEITKIAVVVEKINEKTYNPLIRGFIINIEDVILFDYCNDTDIHIYAYAGLDCKISSCNSSGFYHLIYHMHDYLPKTLYARIDYTVHVIINPYAEIWYSNYKYIPIGFHVKVYSGSIIIPITIIPE